MAFETMTAARLRLAVFAAWLLACAILLGISWSRIASLSMWDPDDYLRLQQVRDLLGGQSFFDVAQYRIDPPHGVPMHWSRIVDLPIAGLILLLQPLLGGVLAERVAISVVPLLILAGSMTAIALIGVRLADRRTALLTAMLASAAPLMLFHDLPMRIDHHGWQTTLGLFTIAACFDPRPRRSGAVAGTAAALWLAISLEALPMVVAIAALLALRFVMAGDGRGAARRFRWFSAVLSAAGILLFTAFHGRAAYSLYYCDAVSPAWFGPLAVAPAIIALLVPAAVRRGRMARVGLLIGAGACGVALLAAIAPACLHGPFAALDPLVRHYWYDNVLEGQPVWKQPIDNRAMLIGFPLIGIACTLLAYQRAPTVAAARNWLMMLALLLAAFAVSLLVQRAGAFAHGCALPGAGFVLARLLDAIGRWRQILLRVLASASAIMAVSPLGAVVASRFIFSEQEQVHAGDARPAAPRAPGSNEAALAKLPPAYIFSGVDLTPRLLVMTPHSFAGSSHHRDPQAIHRVIAGFIGAPPVAHRIMAEHGMDYVLIDPASNEAAIYGSADRHGLMAGLLRGEAPDWLTPVPLEHSTFKLWRRVS